VVWAIVRRDTLPLLPVLTWILLGIWSTPYLLDALPFGIHLPFVLRLPYAGYLDAITLGSAVWLPLSLAAGFAIVMLGEWVLGLADGLSPRRRTTWRVASALLLVAAGTFYGAANGLNLSPPNDYKLYVSQADAEALAWMRDKLPPKGYVVADPFHFPWSNSVLGSDAGLWVPLITGRRTTVPPMQAYNERLADPKYLENMLDVVGYEPLQDSPPADFQALKQAGITHIFVGSRGEHFDVKQLLTSNQTVLVFHKDSAWVFRLK
ncbi:MAG: hypothetical protein M3014_04055, partial [Chloroflexota bacterium]|nr:hypothetical protein [Chloroflexota bacterium]